VDSALLWTNHGDCVDSALLWTNHGDCVDSALLWTNHGDCVDSALLWTNPVANATQLCGSWIRGSQQRLPLQCNNVSLVVVKTDYEQESACSWIAILWDAALKKIVLLLWRPDLLRLEMSMEFLPECPAERQTWHREDAVVK